METCWQEQYIDTEMKKSFRWCFDVKKKKETNVAMVF